MVKVIIFSVLAMFFLCSCSWPAPTAEEIKEDQVNSYNYDLAQCMALHLSRHPILITQKDIMIVNELQRRITKQDAFNVAFKRTERLLKEDRNYIEPIAERACKLHGF